MNQDTSDSIVSWFLYFGSYKFWQIHQIKKKTFAQFTNLTYSISLIANFPKPHGDEPKYSYTLPTRDKKFYCFYSVFSPVVKSKLSESSEKPGKSTQQGSSVETDSSVERHDKQYACQPPHE